MSDITSKILFTIACIVLPILWGVLVNWLFDVFQARDSRKSEEEPIFPDYQI